MSEVTVYLTKNRIAKVLVQMQEIINQRDLDHEYNEIRSGLCYIALKVDYDKFFDDKDGNIYYKSRDLQMMFELWFAKQRPTATLYSKWYYKNMEGAQEGSWWFYSWAVDERYSFLTQLIKDNDGN